MRVLPVFAVVLLCGCPTPSNPDGSTGGGIGGGGGGSATGGAGGGSTGGGAFGGGGGAATGGGSALGGGAGGGDADSGVPMMIALAPFCASYAAQSCAQLAACGKYESPTSPACLREQNRVVQPLCEQALSGAVTYDGVQGFNCLAEISGTPTQCYVPFWSCGMLRGSARAVFNTRVNACGSATCDGGVCDQSCTGPSCQPFRSIGQSCSETAHPVTSCDPATSTCGTLDGGALECLALARAGESCEYLGCVPGTRCVFTPTVHCEATLDAGASCQPGDPCAEGLCRTDGVCGPRPIGAACASSIDCGDFQSPNICRGLTLSSDGGVLSMGQCQPRPSIGEACDYAWAVSTDPCRMDLAQGCIDGTCRQLTPFAQPSGTECPIRAYGRVEAPFYGFAICARGLACLPSTTAHAPKTGRCGPARLPGEPCRDVLMCAPGNECLTVSDGGRECVHVPALGEDCSSRGCRFDTFCKSEDDGGLRCAFRGEADAGCSAGAPCATDLLCSGAPGVCEPIDVLGNSCSYDFECSGLACSNGHCVAMCAR